MDRRIDSWRNIKNFLVKKIVSATMRREVLLSEGDSRSLAHRGYGTEMRRQEMLLPSLGFHGKSNFYPQLLTRGNWNFF